MASRKKLPYLQLYVNDFADDEKLRMCSASSAGIYIFLLCILHKSQDYGKLTLAKENDSPNAAQKLPKRRPNVALTSPERKLLGDNTETLGLPKVALKCSEFAKKLSKLMPFSAKVIKSGLLELCINGVIVIEGETLCQPRMVKDFQLSEARRKNINKRWDSKKNESSEATDFVYTKTDTKPDTKHNTNAIQNSEDEYEYDNIYNIYSIEKGVQGERKRSSFSPPTIEEVKAYVSEKKFCIDAERFYDFYESKNWYIGKNKMKDWKAAARNWDREEKERKKTKTTTTSKNANDEWN